MNRSNFLYVATILEIEKANLMISIDIKYTMDDLESHELSRLLDEF